MNGCAVMCPGCAACVAVKKPKSLNGCSFYGDVFFREREVNTDFFEFLKKNFVLECAVVVLLVLLKKTKIAQRTQFLLDVLFREREISAYLF